jgi:hypothetical protein
VWIESELDQTTSFSTSFKFKMEERSVGKNHITVFIKINEVSVKGHRQILKMGIIIVIAQE